VSSPVAVLNNFFTDSSYAYYLFKTTDPKKMTSAKEKVPYFSPGDLFNILLETESGLNPVFFPDKTLSFKFWSDWDGV